MEHTSKIEHPAPGVTVETGTIVHEGREFSAGGACVTPAHLTAYLGTPTTGFHYPGCHSPGRWGAGTFGPVNTWGGETIGRYTLDSSRVCWGTRVYHVTIHLSDGSTYYGRSQGPGMVVNAKRKASQLKEGT